MVYVSQSSPCPGTVSYPFANLHTQAFYFRLDALCIPRGVLPKFRARKALEAWNNVTFWRLQKSQILVQKILAACVHWFPISLV